MGFKAHIIPFTHATLKNGNNALLIGGEKSDEAVRPKSGSQKAKSVEVDL